MWWFTGARLEASGWETYSIVVQNLIINGIVNGEISLGKGGKRVKWNIGWDLLHSRCVAIIISYSSKNAKNNMVTSQMFLRIYCELKKKRWSFGSSSTCGSRDDDYRKDAPHFRVILAEKSLHFYVSKWMKITRILLQLSKLCLFVCILVNESSQPFTLCNEF